MPGHVDPLWEALFSLRSEWGRVVVGGGSRGGERRETVIDM